MHIVKRIQHGEPVTPEVANRPIEDIVQWLSSLTSKVNGYTDTANNIIYNQPLDEDVHVGAPVYFNKSTGKYSRARASSRLEHDRLVPDDCCYALGIVVRKSAPTVGDICLSGSVTIDFTEGDNQEAFQDYSTVGLRYLSGAPGRVVTDYPVISIPVAFVTSVDSAGKADVVVNVCLDSILSGHRHLRLAMRAAPAGDWSPGDTTISVINTNIEGWLPVSVFGGGDDVEIPAGAKFWYNPAPGSVLREHLPVISPPALILFWSQYTNDSDPVPVVGEVHESLYEVNTDGIWWMNSDIVPWYSVVPWVNSEPSEQIPDIPQDMWAYYTRITYNTDDTVVTSLTPAVSSGLSVTNSKTGDSAIRGDLQIDLSLEGKEASRRYRGPLALKYVGSGYDQSTGPDEAGNIDEAGGIEVKNGFFYGPVVESIEADSMSMDVVSLDCVTTADGRPTGRILLKAGDAWDKLPLPIQSMHLDQMRDAFIGGMGAISFIPNQKSGFSGNIYIPWFNKEKSSIRIKLTLMCGSSGQVSDTMFTGRYIVIPSEPCNIAFPLPIGIPSLCDPHGTEQDLRFSFDVLVPNPYMYFCVESEPIEVTPGSMVWFCWHKTGNAECNQLSVIKMEAYIYDDEYAVEELQEPEP